MCICVLSTLHIYSTYTHSTRMGRIDVILPDDLEDKLRMEVGRRVGVKRGALTNALIEAIQDWLKKK